MLLVKGKNDVTALQINLSVPQMVKHGITIQPSDFTPRYTVYSAELETYVHAKMYSQIFVATLCTMAEKWEQHTFPWIDHYKVKGGILEQ